MFILLEVIPVAKSFEELKQKFLSAKQALAPEVADRVMRGLPVPNNFSEPIHTFRLAWIRYREVLQHHS